MILDNENQHLKVHEWISKYTQEGKLSIVTGYFTIGALAYLSKKTQEKINQYRFVLGDIVNFDSEKDRALDLLNENISISSSLALSQVAKDAVAFLELEKVIAKTLEPNFCHAKVYLFSSEENDPQKNYFVSGSSNLTEAGIGMKITNNVELNIASFGSDAQYNELIPWFEQLWNRPQAHDYKTVIDENGKEKKIPFKKYLIDEIKKIFKEYRPKDIYYKILFELFGDDVMYDTENPDFNKQIGRLENTDIYQALYEFQQKGVISLIKMLQSYNGAILADAVGLGKTWTALAVMKYYQMQGSKVIMLCPKKLEQNWSKFLESDNRFEKDNFDYILRFHTDLVGERWNTYQRKNKYDISQMIDDKPKLLVIDESHNLRNSKSNRYKYMVEEILQKANGTIRVLMLSATPINNSLVDIRNQFKLIVQGKTDGFRESLDIKNIDHTFQKAQAAFNKWSKEPDSKLAEFIKLLPPNFFKLTDALTVARTRKMIEGQQDNLVFPKKNKPENVFVTPKQIGNFDNFEELFDHFPPLLSGYLPSLYTETDAERLERLEKKHGKDRSVLQDDQQRDMFLVKMMYILLVKRLESSWFSFQSTVEKIHRHHQTALDRIKKYELSKNKSELQTEVISIFEDDDELTEEFENFSLGAKRPVSLSDIDKAGRLKDFKHDLKKDIEALQLLQSNLKHFSEQIKLETSLKSADDKLAFLLKRISEKQKTPNRKLVIFTVYKDTAYYLYDEFLKRGFDRVAVVSGQASRVYDTEGETKKFEPILQRFAPYTKLYAEKEWKAFQPSSEKLTSEKQYDEWVQWIATQHIETYNKVLHPIDILIATDVLSEGQNLQDADLVVNYDIHWNPVRVIQRMGRIDRLGSQNKDIYAINFWPSDNINNYLNLQRRIEQRMASMKLAGSEVHLHFSDSFKAMAEDESLEQAQNERMLRQMQSTWDDIESASDSIGFDHLSLEVYRQELLMELKKNQKFFESMPRGIYTGFIANSEICPTSGTIALLGYPAACPPKTKSHQYKGHELIYIDNVGNPVLLNQKEVLDAVSKHKEYERDNESLRDFDQGNNTVIDATAQTLYNWIKTQAVEEEIQEDGTVKERMGKAQMDLITKLKAGSRQAVETLKGFNNPSEKYKAEHFDLIAWIVVNAQ